MHIPKRKLRYFSYYLLGIATLFLALFVIFDRYQMIINTTESYPIGFYQKRLIDRPIQRGDLVMFCLPKGNHAELILARGYLPRGSCDNGLQPLLKRVYAVAGDEVNVDSSGVSVNCANVIKNSIPIREDMQGRALPLMKSVIIPADHYAVFSAYHLRSFDTRYFGPIHRDSIDYFVEPLWVLDSAL